MSLVSLSGMRVRYQKRGQGVEERVVAVAKVLRHCEVLLIC